MSNKCIEICDAATAVTCALVPAATRQDDAACAPQSLGTSRFRSSLAPTYYHDDLAYLVKQGCITQGRFTPLYNARGARRFVARQLELGRECVGALRDYPSLRIAPLQWHYACLLSLRVLDEALITDLIRGPWWVETVWASFLALLDPRPGFAKPLEAVSGEWLVDAALAEIRGEAPAPELREFVSKIPEPYGKSWPRRRTGPRVCAACPRPSSAPSSTVSAMQSGRPTAKTVSRALRLCYRGPWRRPTGCGPIPSGFRPRVSGRRGPGPTIVCCCKRPELELEIDLN